MLLIEKKTYDDLINKLSQLKIESLKGVRTSDYRIGLTHAEYEVQDLFYHSKEVELVDVGRTMLDCGYEEETVDFFESYCLKNSYQLIKIKIKG